VVESNATATGPGAARNRALEYVRGTAVASLDDDDELSVTYVEDALTALASKSAVVFPTRYSNIRVIAQQLHNINIEQFGRLLGSLHVVARRECFPPWPNCFAEDVIHTCEVIEQQGGSIPVINTAEYILNVREASMCATYKNIDAEYADIIRTTTSPAIANLFKYRQHVNGLYQGSNQNYHAFVEQLTTNEINSIIHF
jgi:glycosyltransferase involved in cell wall biosynthesis